MTDAAREALEKIRLHGSSWWRDEWGTPASLANAALLAEDEYAAREEVEWTKAAKAVGS